MFGNLLAKAVEEGFTSFELCLIIHKPSGILLLESPKRNGETFFDLPKGVIKSEESLNQALDRIVIEQTNLKLEQVEKLLCYFDTQNKGKKTRRYYFVARTLDPESIQTSKGHAWVEPQEAVGYPINDELREAFDFYVKT